MPRAGQKRSGRDDDRDSGDRRRYFAAAMQQPHNRQLYELMARQLYHDGYVDAAESLVQSANIAVPNIHKHGDRLSRLVTDGLLTNVLRARETSEYGLRHRVEHYLEANALYVPLVSRKPGKQKMEVRFVTSSLGGIIRCVATSPFGDLIACGGSGGIGARIFSRPAIEEEMLVSDVAGIQDASVAILTATTIAEARAFTDHSLAVETVAFHPREPWLLTGGREGHLFLLDYSTPEKHVLLKHEDNFPVRHASFHPNGCHAVFATDHNAPRLISVATGQLQTVSKNPHTAALSQATYSPDGRSVVTTSFDGSFALFDSTTSQQVLHKTAAHSGVPVTSAVFSRSAMTILTCGMDGVARLWDLRKVKDEVLSLGVPKKTEYRIQARFNSAESTVVMQDASLLNICTYDIYSSSLVSTVSTANAGQPQRCFSCCPYDSAFVSGGDDGKLRLWSLSALDFSA